MTHPDFLRDKARQMRAERKLTIDQIAERLALSRSTVYHWVRDMPIERKRWNVGQKRGNLAMQAKFQLLREHAYMEGREEFANLATDPGFRDFLCMYIGEGSKRSRGTVQICNSDPAVMRLANDWMLKLSRKQLGYRIQWHADQDLVELVRFWAELLKVPPDCIRLQRKSNSNALTGRNWRSRWGVLSIEVHDTLLRARLQGWMDSIREEWVETPLTEHAGGALAV